MLKNRFEGIFEGMRVYSIMNEEMRVYFHHPFCPPVQHAQHAARGAVGALVPGQGVGGLVPGLCELADLRGEEGTSETGKGRSSARV